MQDAEILKLLATLGIDEMSHKALALLPLIHVAWADGVVQRGEHGVLDKALAKWQPGPEGTRLVRNWLTYPPSQEYVERGRTALVALAVRTGGLQLEAQVLADVLEMARAVAKAAGGLWGFGAISDEEEAALDEIAAALELAEGMGWRDAVQAELADEPSRQRVLIKFDTQTLDLGRMPGVLVPIYNTQVQIPIEERSSIGSSDECDVVITEHTVNGHHCDIWIERGQFYVTDVEGSSGTWLDGERIVERRLLGGEILRLGQIELRFQLLRRVPNQMIS